MVGQDKIEFLKDSNYDDIVNLAVKLAEKDEKGLLKFKFKRP